MITQNILDTPFYMFVESIWLHEFEEGKTSLERKEWIDENLEKIPQFFQRYWKLINTETQELYMDTLMQSI